MYYLLILAQEGIPVKDLGFYKAVVEGTKQGIENTSSTRPSEWLMCLLILVLTLVGVKYLGKRDTQLQEAINDHKDTLIEKDKSTAAAIDKLNETAAKFNETVVTLQKDSAINERIARDSCHATALELQKGVPILHEMAHELKDAVLGIAESNAAHERMLADQKQIVHDQRNIMATTKSLQEVILTQMLTRPVPPTQHEHLHANLPPKSPIITQQES